AGFYRPEVIEWCRSIEERYSPPEKPVLLLLPCSHKKPYSLSKTHKLISKTLEEAEGVLRQSVSRGSESIPSTSQCPQSSQNHKNHPPQEKPPNPLIHLSINSWLHRVVVTSPLGIVPMELENFYPANSYDIPVVGQWLPEEKERIQSLLKCLIEKGKYRYAIIHLGGESGFIAEVLKSTGIPYCSTVENEKDEKPLSEAALNRLKKTLVNVIMKMNQENVAAGVSSPGKYSREKEKYEEICASIIFQFGRMIFPEDIHIIGKYPFWKIEYQKKQLAMFVPEKSQWSLTLEGAGFLAGAGINVIETEDFELKGTLFCKGIINADKRIRPGDEVVIVSEKSGTIDEKENSVETRIESDTLQKKLRVKACGVAALSGREMMELKKGVAVKVRHRAS
ncbi:MAG: DUF5591 domain-containing protein, partial [Thermoplasmata archaeon]